MKMLHALSIATVLLGLSAQAAAGPPIIIDSRTGQYLGTLSANPYQRDSTSNPYGRYGSPYSQDSINNPYSRHGSAYSPDSPTNPYAAGNRPAGVEPLPNLPGASY